jgi:hypothetical protein
LDGGTTWNAYNSGLSMKEVRDLAIDPTNSDIVFAATSRGLYKTADGGQNWVRTSLTSYSEVYSVLVNSEEPNNIYASMKGRVYHSTDGGSTWNELGSGISYSDYILSLAYKHGTPDVIFAGGGHVDYSDNIQGSVYSLAIGSSSWSEILDKAYCSEIFSVPNSNDIYISTFNDGIFHFSNGGSTWKKLDVDLPYNTSDAITVTSNAVYGSFRFGSVWKTDLATGVKGHNHNLSNYRLYQNYPNPFSSVTTIKYFLPQSTELKVTVYNIKGNTIRILYEGHLNAGSYSIQWDGLNDKGQAVGSGIYFYQIKTPDFQDTRSMILRR